MAKKIIDLTGQQFGKLTVLERAEDYVTPKGKHQIMWKCQCECGNTKNIRGVTLRNGKSTSCGCVQKNIVRKTGYANKKYNEYDLSGEYGIGFVSNNRKFYFDLEDYGLIKEYSWCMDAEGYVIGSPYGNKKQILLHILIMNPNHNEDIDHINHNPSDNRKNNLRIVTRSQNQMNVGLSSNNKSGVTGVHFNTRNEKWVAQIGFNRKRIYLGEFDNFDNAVKARKEAEIKYFGEYSYDNSQKKNDRKPMKMTQQERIEYDELYQYVRNRVMGYDISQSLSRYMVFRLKGLKVGKYIENRDIKDKANYSYAVILATFKFSILDIEKGFRTKNFSSETQKFNYALAIVENNLNTVYVRMQNSAKAKEATENIDVSSMNYSGAEYQKKTGKTSSKLNDLW